MNKKLTATAYINMIHLLVVITCWLLVNNSQSTLIPVLPGLMIRLSLCSNSRMLNSTSFCVWTTEVFPLSSCCLYFHPTFHHHTGLMETLSPCQHTHHAHTMPSRWRQRHKISTTETATVGPSWRPERKSELNLNLELSDKWEHLPPGFFSLWIEAKHLSISE